MFQQRCPITLQLLTQSMQALGSSEQAEVAQVQLRGLSASKPVPRASPEAQALLEVFRSQGGTRGRS